MTQFEIAQHATAGPRDLAAPLKDATAVHAPVDPITVKSGGGSAKRTVGVIAALGVACMACLIPGLAVGGAGILAAGAIGEDEAIMGAVALGLATYAIYATVKRRRAAAAAPTANCGCQ